MKLIDISEALMVSIIRAMMVNFYENARRNFPEDSHFHNCRCENLKCHIHIVVEMKRAGS